MNGRAREVWIVIAAAGATLAIQNGIYAASAASIWPREAVLTTLAASILWIAVSAGTLAAGAATSLRAVLRAAAVADASAVTLIVLCLAARDPTSGHRYVPIVGALKIYCTYAAVALAAAAAVRCARSPAGRAAAGVLVAAPRRAALATPLWSGGIRNPPARAGQSARTEGITFIGEALSFNPFYSITSAVADRTGFVWHQAPLMYRITAVGDIVAPPPVRWYAAPIRYAGAALLLAAVALLRHTLRPRPNDEC